jgi:glycosyltransferase involved in cell wall biosynthesis
LKPFSTRRFKDWELIVCDSYSDDGAWEFFQEHGGAGANACAFRKAPREGTAGQLESLASAQARGEYVYIATSDDTMTPDCLEKLVAALDQHPDCGVAHCCLTFIDEKSRPVLAHHRWENWSTTLFMDEWNRKPHVRPRGHDTVMALGLNTAYYSVTQILIRRSLFDDIGMFGKNWGSFADLEWQMRAALATKTVHVPEHLATWRIHPQQASQADRYKKAARDGWFMDMVDTVIEFSRARNLPFPGGLPTRLRRFFWDEHIGALLGAEKNYSGKFRVLFKSLRQNPEFFTPFFRSRFRKYITRQEPDTAIQVRKELHRLGLDILSPVESRQENGFSRNAAK